MNNLRQAPAIKLLVAVDHSAHSGAALHWLASLKRAGFGAHCVLLNVQAPVMSGEVGPITTAYIAAEAHERSARAALEHAAQVLRQADIAYTTLCDTATDTAGAILACAEAQGCDAIVLGRRGRGALSAVLLGSVSAGVLQRAAIPVIVINQDVEPVAAPPLRILLATDGSPAASRAAAMAAGIAAQSSGGELHVLHVRPDVSAAQAMLGALEHITAQLTAQTEARALDGARGIAERAGCVCALFPVVAGVPHKVILHQASAVNAGMIAMGTRGMSPASALVMGSVAQQVIRNARVPVLLARAGV